MKIVVFGQVSDLSTNILKGIFEGRLTEFGRVVNPYTEISLKPTLFVISNEVRNLYATGFTIQPGRFLLVPRRNDIRLNILKSTGVIHHLLLGHG
jgi:hypothetical protein